MLANIIIGEGIFLYTFQFVGMVFQIASLKQFIKETQLTK